MEEFRTSIFEKTKEKSKKRLLYNLAIIAAIAGVWILYFMGFPLPGFKLSLIFSFTLLSWKLYQDKYMGITAYGERKDNLIIGEQYLVIRDVKIPYSDLRNLVIYVEEYLGKPREFFGIHHGGNNKIEFEHNGRTVSLNYVIKNKQDYDKVSKLVDRIEKDPSLKKYMLELD